MTTSNFRNENIVKDTGLQEARNVATNVGLIRGQISSSLMWCLLIIYILFVSLLPLISPNMAISLFGQLYVDSASELFSQQRSLSYGCVFSVCLSKNNTKGWKTFKNVHTLRKLAYNIGTKNPADRHETWSLVLTQFLTLTNYDTLHSCKFIQKNKHAIIHKSFILFMFTWKTTHKFPQIKYGITEREIVYHVVFTSEGITRA